MKHTELNKGLISGLLERYKNVKIRVPDTLFDIEPDWNQLKETRCPICGTKLTLPLNRRVAICRGKRHGDKKPFIIKLETLAKLRN